MTLLGRDRYAPLSWLSLDVDRELDVLAVRGLGMAIATHRALGRVAIEAVARRGQVSYRLGSANPVVLQSMIEAALPSCVAHACERDVPMRGSAWVVEANTRRRPLTSADAEGASRRLLSALTARSDVTVIHQLVVGQRLQPLSVPNHLEEIAAESWAGAFQQAVMSGRTKVDAEARRALADKQGLHGAEVTARLLVVPAAERSGVASSYIAACRSLEGPGVRLRLRKEQWGKAVVALPSRRAIPLNVDELTGLLAWPYGDASYPGVDRTGARKLLARQPEQHARVVGITTHPSREISLGQKVDDALRHLHVIGPTGVGKSTLLLNLILQDIEAGRGAVVLDPKGDLVSDVLARASDRQRDRLVVLDAARTDQVVGFNPLQVGATNHELAVDSLLHVFHELHANSWGPRTQDVLHNSLLTLIGTPWASLAYVPQLLGDPVFRRKVLSTAKPHHTVQFFWTWYDSLGDAERSSVIAPLSNKLRPFLLRSSLRGLIGQVEPRFDPRSVFTQNKVLLVPLHKGLIGAEATNLLGSLVVSRLWQLALERSAIPASRRKPIFFYLDEFQDYLRLPTDLADVLAQARGLGLGLVLAHQHLGQLTTSVRAAVMANAQSRICFRLGAEDANVIAKSAPELEAVDLTQLSEYRIYAKLLSDGQPMPFASARTIAPTKTLRQPRVLADQLAKEWGRSLADVDAELQTKTQSRGSGQGSIGRKKRARGEDDGAGGPK